MAEDERKCSGEKTCDRCGTTRDAGGQCRNRTCTTSKCWQHLQSKDHLRVKTSEIPGAGKGLFAAKETRSQRGYHGFRRGETIAPYVGERMSKAELDNACPADKLAVYAVERNKRGDVINAYKTTDGAARYANDPRGTEEQANARLQVVSGGRVNLVARSAIEPEEEILVQYGRSYWEGRP
jgi:hypothetical protein